MTQLVREHVCLSKVAWRAKLALELVEESKIKVDPLIARTVKRAGGRLRETARRLDRVAEEHRVRVLVPRSQDLPPRRLGVGKDSVDHVDHPLFTRCCRPVARGPDGCRRRHAAAVSAET